MKKTLPVVLFAILTFLFLGALSLHSPNVVATVAADFTEEGEEASTVVEDFMAAGSEAVGFTVEVDSGAEAHFAAVADFAEELGFAEEQGFAEELSAAVFVEVFAAMASGAVSVSAGAAGVGEAGAGIGAGPMGMGIGLDTAIPTIPLILTDMGTTLAIRRRMTLTMILPMLLPTHRRLGGIGTTRTLILRRTAILNRPA